jgi:hypothetical protein
MKRASYREAIEWVAYNDSAGVVSSEEERRRPDNRSTCS